MDLNLFLPIVKVDVERRLVFGTIAEEIADKSGEIMDYASARPQFEAWSAEIEKASDGKSLGNLRAMHGNVAAGKLERISFDDAARRIEACGKIVDDREWAKVLEGVYTGFSMGGKYLRRWADAEQPHLTRYTPQPFEVSLVDNPCIPTATFEVVKADGSREMRKFRGAQPPPAARAEEAAKADRSGEAVAKAGARNSAADLEKIQALHDTAVELGADCTGAADALDEDAADFVTLAACVLRKFRDDMTPKIDAIASDAASLRAEVERLKAEPAPGGPVLAHAVTKGQDTRSGAPAGDAVAAFREHLETLEPGARARVLMKLSLANPLAAAPRG